MKLFEQAVNIFLNASVPFSLGAVPVNVREQRLQSLVRKYPYWADGHRQCGEILFASGKFQEAFLATQTTAILDPENRKNKLLLSKILLRFGRYSESEKILLALKRGRSNGSGKSDRANNEILEYLAAAHMALEREHDARSVLSEIPEQELSPGSAVLLQHLKAKQ